MRLKQKTCHHHSNILHQVARILHPHVALLHGLVEVARLCGPRPQDLSAGAVLGGLAICVQFEGAVDEEEFGELIEAVEGGEEGKAQCHIDQEEARLADVVAGVLLVTRCEVQHHCQQHQVHQDEDHRGCSQKLAGLQFVAEDVAGGPLGDQFEGVAVLLVADLAVEALGTEYLFALQGVFSFLADPGVEALDVHELHAPRASAGRDQSVVCLLGAQADAALPHGLAGHGCPHCYTSGLQSDHSRLHFSIMRRSGWKIYKEVLGERTELPRESEMKKVIGQIQHIDHWMRDEFYMDIMIVEDG